MATTGIWKVEKRLDHVLDYVMNVDKTTKLSHDSKVYQELHCMKEYSNMDYNSEESCYVSGINCLPHRVYNDMMDTKKQYDKFLEFYHVNKQFLKDEDE